MQPDSFFTIAWRDGAVVMIDQRALPTREVYRSYTDYRGVARAITDMVIRGAPAIGVAAAMGIALGVRQLKRSAEPAVFARICQVFAATRPTAVNLFWAIDRMRRRYEKVRAKGRDALIEALEQEALKIYREDIAANRRIGRYGAKLIPQGATVLTHCNAGALATAGYGTALGVIRSAWEQGKNISVFVPETRPYLQGARLTAWELVREGIPATLITDNMIGHFMQKGAMIASLWAPTAPRPMGMSPTRSARIRLPCWPGDTSCRSMWPPRPPRLFWTVPPARRFPLKNGPPRKSPMCCASRLPPAGSRLLIRLLMSPPIAWSARSLRKRG